MTTTPQHRDEYVTIVAPTAAQAMAQFKAQALDAQGYAIAGRVGRHRIAVVGESGAETLVQADGMVAATFVRRVPA